MRLFIDLEICNKCSDCVVKCSYFYHPTNNGITTLREYATFSLVCRQCQEAVCVKSCYRSALEKQSDGILKRYNFLCTSCRACVIVCPFGTVFSEFIPYLQSQCDYCLDRRDLGLPSCIGTCPYKAVELREIEESLKENIFFVGNNLAVKSRKWFKEEILPKR